MLLSYSYCLESREGISNILRIHWSTTSYNITSWDLLGNKVSDKSAWWEAPRSQIAVSNVTFRKNARGKGRISGKNRPRQQAQGPDALHEPTGGTELFLLHRDFFFFPIIIVPNSLWYLQISITNIWTAHSIYTLPQFGKNDGKGGALPQELYVKTPVWQVWLGMLLSRKVHIWNLFKIHVWSSQVVVVIKNPLANAGNARDVGLLPGSGRSHREG